MKDTIFNANFSLNCRGNLRVYKHPIVMGIINTTPDSFYANSRNQTIQSGMSTARKMIEEGAEIIDIGGYSSRPGAHNISVKDEIIRVTSLIEAIKQEFPNQLISIDTFRTEVAKAAIEAGADIINDISGGHKNPSIFELAANKKTPYIMMHMKGTPQNMQTNTDYSNLMSDIIGFFSTQIQLAKQTGLNDIILDPGIGFSKTLDQNYQLIKNLNSLTIFNQPILIGVSRKSLLYKLLDIKPENALNATTALNSLCLINGARILRVHDVKAAIEAVSIYNKVLSA